MRRFIHPSERCPRCFLRPALCLCAEVRPRPTATRVVIIMHHLERKILTNTARIAALVLPNCEVRVRGAKDQPLDGAGLVGPDGDTRILFPREDAGELNAGLAASLRRPLTLIVPDGNWVQAKKVCTRVPELRGVPCLKLPPGPPSAYAIRRAPFGHGVSTLEAIARALGILESPEVQAELERMFRLFVDRTLWARGLKRPEHVLGGIPPAAIEEQRAAGRRLSGRDRPAGPPAADAVRGDPGCAGESSSSPSSK